MDSAWSDRRCLAGASAIAGGVLALLVVGTPVQGPQSPPEPAGPSWSVAAELRAGSEGAQAAALPHAERPYCATDANWQRLPADDSRAAPARVAPVSDRAGGGADPCTASGASESPRHTADHLDPIARQRHLRRMT